MLIELNWRKESSEDPNFVATLEKLRSEIDALDAELLSILARRMYISERTGEIKRANDVAILQPARWNALLDSLIARAESLNLSAEFVRSLFELIHEESIKRQ
jgi:chorismate mutase